MVRILDDAIAALPRALDEPVRRWQSRLQDAGQTLPPGVDAERLVRLIACSEFAAATLLADWESLAPRLASFDDPPDPTRLSEFADDIIGTDRDFADVQSMLRQKRKAWHLQVLWRDVNALADTDETLASLSVVADELLRAAAGYATAKMAERFGRVVDETGREVPLVILGMGKLGGRELNFSSDVDLIFAYPRNGSSDGPRSLHAQEYFDRLSRQVVRLIDEVTADGFAFRADTRLRPFGDSGPPVVSFVALESYLLQHGREWERYAYVKARPVGPRLDAAGRVELFGRLIEPFVYRRYLDYGVFEALRDMHGLIDVEVRRRDLADNIKLGPGGIREIEFIVQSLQLVRGGADPALRESNLLAVLPRLVGSRGLGADAASRLAESYRFLRRFENLLQAIADRQVHDVPEGPLDRARLCLAFGVDAWETLRERLDAHREFVSRQFGEIAFREVSEDTPDDFARDIRDAWERAPGVEEWTALLAANGIAEAGNIADTLVAFRRLPAAAKIEQTARRRLLRFLPTLLSLSKAGRHPAMAVSRCIAIVEQIMRRSAYLALLNENPLASERLLHLCDRSAYIAGELAQHPLLLDELLDQRLLTGPLTRQELSVALAGQLAHPGIDDSEDRTEALAHFQRATMFRIAVADFDGALPLMKVSDNLTFLAEVVLEEALAMAWQDLVAMHGTPCYVAGGDARPAGFGVIAYGKLGGLELSYGSDLDIVFLHDSHGEQQRTDGPRPLENALFFSRLVRRLVHILTTQTRSGALYQVDTRLRPSGRKGLLVTSVESFERYQAENAWTWEHQALLRARPVAGSDGIARAFARVRAGTLTRPVDDDTLRKDVLDMRRRMREELDRSDDDSFDLKQGRGGIGDIEFMVQYLVLGNASAHASLIEFSDNMRQLDALSECGCIDPRLARSLQDIYLAYRQRLHHLVLDDAPAEVPVTEFVGERQVVGNAWERIFGS